MKSSLQLYYVLLIGSTASDQGNGSGSGDEGMRCESCDNSVIFCKRKIHEGLNVLKIILNEGRKIKVYLMC